VLRVSNHATPTYSPVLSAQHSSPSHSSLSQPPIHTSLLFCQIHWQDSGVFSNCHVSFLLYATLILKLQFWLMISLLAKHRARLNKDIQRERVSNHKKRMLSTVRTANFTPVLRKAHHHKLLDLFAKQQSQGLTHACLKTRIMLIQAIQNTMRHHAMRR
jgi:hypothetical protein